jgi:hypothetical protein
MYKKTVKNDKHCSDVQENIKQEQEQEHEHEHEQEQEQE